MSDLPGYDSMKTRAPDDVNPEPSETREEEDARQLAEEAELLQEKVRRAIEELEVEVTKLEEWAEHVDEPAWRDMRRRAEHLRVLIGGLEKTG